MTRRTLLALTTLLLAIAAHAQAQGLPPHAPPPAPAHLLAPAPAPAPARRSPVQDRMQTPPALQPGDRVRIRQTGGDGEATGVVVAVTGDTLTWIPDANGPGESTTVLLSSLTALDVGRGSQRNTGTGAFIGGTVGLVGGTLLGLATWQPCEGWCVMHSSRGTTALLSGGIVGFVGAGVGAIVGTASVTERWEPHSLAPNLSMKPAADGGVRLGMEWRF